MTGHLIDTAHLIGYEIACDGPTSRGGCPESSTVPPSYASRSAAQVRADGRRDGWTRPRGRDCCPTCTATRKEPPR